MRLCYVLLSPTWGMHQYTADLANRMAAAGHEVHLVTTRRVPRDRYAPEVVMHTPIDAWDRGFSPYGLLTVPWVVRRSLSTIWQVHPDAVHVTGVHLCNPLLLRALRRAGLPTVHTLHDLHPHAGSSNRRLIYLWNRWMRDEADHLLVHGRRWRDELLAASPEGGRDVATTSPKSRRDAVARGSDPSRVTCTLLTHLFVGYERQQALEQALPAVRYEPWALFMGRLEAYKGLDVLVEAARRVEGRGVGVVIAGPGRLDAQLRALLPANVDLRPGLVGDDEAVELFRRCGLVVLPYIEASQSALVAAAYFFGKPAVVTRAGALPEYVIEGETGWVVAPGDPWAMAEALESALADPQLLARLGRAGRTWYAQQRQAEGATLQAMYASLVRCGRP